MIRLVPGWRTPSAVLHDFTVRKGPYRWWGLIIGRCFFGFMFANPEESSR